MDLMTVGWLLFNAAVAGAVGFYLISKRKTLEIPRKLLSFMIIFTVFHQIEEYVFPAGFPFIFNLSSGADFTNMAGYPLDPISALITNAVFVIIISGILWKFAEKAWSIMLVAIACLAQLGIHLGLARTSLELFGNYGQAILYSPGLFVGVALYLPLSIYAIVYLIKNRSSSLKNVSHTLKSVGIAVLAMAVISFGTIMLPQMILGNPDAPRVFENMGIYERYSDQFK